MKPLRLNRVIGLALGEGSAMVAEVAAGGGGGRPEVRQLAEFRYPDGVTTADPAALGAALGAFIRDRKFTAKGVVVGLPAKWLIAKPKDVPPADPATLADLLRLQAEGEFSAEQRDLVFDYAADATAGHPTSVLLIATPQKYIAAAVAVCEAAKLTAVAVTPSAVALGAATAGGGSKNAGSPIVLAVGSGVAELTAQAGAAPAAIRHLRGPVADDNRLFVGDLRRTVSTLPGVAATRQMVLWGTDAEAVALNGSLGFPVTAGDLPSLGVTATGSAANGDGRQFAAAVALALSAVGDSLRSVDFLQPRLAPPKARRFPRWAVTAVLAAVVAVAAGVYFYNDLQHREAVQQRLSDDLDKSKESAAAATVFVNKVSFAQGWHGGNPRYLACLRDLTNAIPQDQQTYATNLLLHEPPRSTGVAASAPPPKPGATVPLIGKLEGKTSDPIRAQQVIDRIKLVPGFIDVKAGGITNNGRQASFSVSFTYDPPKVADTPPPAAAKH